jgi:uncharacterized LabA/DUF88 family protein
MVGQAENGTASGRHIALLIDADNVSAAKLPLILAELAKYGTANVRRAYGDWTAPTLKSWTARLHEYAIRPIQQFNYSKGKNATDIALVIDAMELLYTQRLAAFCIASSDADFTPLVMHLRAAGQDVYGFGERKTPEPFVNACTTFLYLDSLSEAVGNEPGAGAAQKPATGRTRSAKSVDKPSEKSDRSLAQDAKLVTVLRGAVDASAGDNGWAALSAAGSAAKRLAPIDPRNYGVANFTRLFEATGLFDIVRGGNGQLYIADRRNKDRVEKPGG